VIVVAVACWSSDSWNVGTGVILSDVVVLSSEEGTSADGVTVRVELANLGSMLFFCFADNDAAFRAREVGAAPKPLVDVVASVIELVGGGSKFVAVARVLGVAGS
jgi:hypothetical protein